jgi:enoyl-[acyl-carrier protein] reductase I
MSLLEGKRGIVTGVVNECSFAYHILQSLLANKADVGLAYLPVSAVERRVKKIAESGGVSFICPMDAQSDESIQTGFEAIKRHFGSIDFFVHSIAFAKVEDLEGRFIDTARQSFSLALEVSAYSLVSMAKQAANLMPRGGSIVTLSYLGSERVVPNYNVMGVAKAALEASVRYIAYDLGPHNIRVNTISAGPQKTLAASVVGDIDRMIDFTTKASPMRRNIEGNDVGKTCVYLLSDLSSGVTGEVLHVDCGYSIMGAPPLTSFI